MKNSTVSSNDLISLKSSTQLSTSIIAPIITVSSLRSLNIQIVCTITGRFNVTLWHSDTFTTMQFQLTILAGQIDPEFSSVALSNDVTEYIVPRTAVNDMQRAVLLRQGFTPISDSILRNRHTAVIAGVELGLRCAVLDQYSNVLTDLSLLHLLIRQNGEVVLPSHTEMLQEADGAIVVLFLLEAPGSYLLDLLYDAHSLATTVPLIVLPVTENAILLYNEAGTCGDIPEIELATTSAITQAPRTAAARAVCGYLGTRNLVETSFIVQVIASYANLLRGRTVASTSSPVTIMFSNEVRTGIA